MKKVAILIIIAILWQQSIGQVDEKEKEKLELFRKLTVSQDSTLKLLNKPVEKKKLSRPEKLPIDTLTVKGNTIITPVDTLYEDLYFVKPDTPPVKKRSFFQRLFGWKILKA